MERNIDNDENVEVVVKPLLPRICDVVPKDALLKMARDSFEPSVYAFVEKIINLLYGPAWGDGGDA